MKVDRNVDWDQRLGNQPGHIHIEDTDEGLHVLWPIEGKDANGEGATAAFRDKDLDLATAIAFNSFKGLVAYCARSQGEQLLRLARSLRLLTVGRYSDGTRQRIKVLQPSTRITTVRTLPHTLALQRIIWVSDNQLALVGTGRTIYRTTIDAEHVIGPVERLFRLDHPPLQSRLHQISVADQWWWVVGTRWPSR